MPAAFCMRHRSGNMIHIMRTIMPMLAFLLVAANAPMPTITPGQQRALARDFICPSALPNDAARIAAVQRFIRRYGSFAPKSRMGERMAYYERLGAERKCPVGDHPLIHTVPEL